MTYLNVFFDRNGAGGNCQHRGKLTAVDVLSKIANNYNNNMADKRNLVGDHSYRTFTYKFRLALIIDLNHHKFDYEKKLHFSKMNKIF